MDLVKNININRVVDITTYYRLEQYSSDKYCLFLSFYQVTVSIK